MEKPTTGPSSIRIQPCDGTHVAAIREIFNEVILGSTALFEYEPRSLATVMNWFESKHAAGLPVLGCFNGCSESPKRSLICREVASLKGVDYPTPQ